LNLPFKPDQVNRHSLRRLKDTNYAMGLGTIPEGIVTRESFRNVNQITHATP